MNHREVIVAFDLFTVPSGTSQLLDCFFVLEHDRRKIRQYHVPSHPQAEWVVQQVRATFPEAGPYRDVSLDRDAKFHADIVDFLKAAGLKPQRTSIASPWKNGIAERWAGRCRRELLDPVIPFNERPLRQLVRDTWPTFSKTACTTRSTKTPRGAGQSRRSRVLRQR